MSSNKRICLRSNTKKRQTFSERFGDDLCEVILQYLPLKVKLRLECVSKQFQKSIFQKQNDLEIDPHIFKKRFNAKLLTSILKKCPNIRSIFIPHWIQKQYNSQVINLVVKYCQHLSEINIINDISKSSWNKLFRKINRNVFRVHLDHGTVKFIPALPPTKRLVIIGWLRLTHLMSFKNITSVMCELHSNDFKDFQTFIENNRNIRFLHIKANDCNKTQFKDLLNQISILRDLIELKIISKIGFNEKILSDPLTRIAVNCIKLKSLYCNFEVNSNDFCNLMDAISPLRQFTRLKRLSLNLIRKSFEENREFQFMLTNGFDKLTHFTLNSTYSYNETVTDLRLYSPKIKYLNISTKLLPTEDIINMLCRLSNLEKIELCVDNTIMRSKITKQLMENCPNIKDITIYCVNN